jgi:hypothetical protein
VPRPSPIGLLALVASLAAILRVDAQPPVRPDRPSIGSRPPVVWATDSAAPCIGLTVAFQADSAAVQRLLAPRWEPGTSHDGKTPVTLFVTRCPRSSIDGKAIGSSTIAAVILGVRARPGSTGVAPVRAAAVPIVYGDSGAPVTELFRRFAFDVRTASVSIVARAAGGSRRVTFVVATPGGRIEASAQVADTARIAVMNSRLVGTDATRASDFSGPEWTRRSRAPATVRASGNTLFTQLGVAEMPTAALYDAGFGWRFTFHLP